MRVSVVHQNAWPPLRKETDDIADNNHFPIVEQIFLSPSTYYQLHQTPWLEAQRHWTRSMASTFYQVAYPSGQTASCVPPTDTT